MYIYDLDLDPHKGSPSSSLLLPNTNLFSAALKRTSPSAGPASRRPRPGEGAGGAGWGRPSRRPPPRGGGGGGMGAFQTPAFYEYPPYFTLQPVAATRAKQSASWRKLILEYCE